MDVSSYLSRLGLDISGEPSPDQLRSLHQRHLLTVPFENLDIHRGVSISLDVGHILRKIIVSRRGGFCYELNGSFAWLLGNLGYKVTLLSAEVARKNGGFGIPFDHMVIRVDLDEP
jgi:N-hydroxyarylamine O-acetyltransferase